MKIRSLLNRLSQYSRIILLSGIGLVTYSVMAILTFFIYHLHLLLNYFKINGSLRLGSYLLEHINKILVAVFGTNNTNVVVLAFFWGSVGLVVYFVISIFASDVTELSEDIYEKRKYIWPKNTKPELVKIFIEKNLLRLALIFLLSFYCAHVLSFFLHGKVASINILGNLIYQWLLVHNFYNDVAFILAEIIALHGVTIILRLVFLKPRLIG